MIRLPPRSPLFPYTTLLRSHQWRASAVEGEAQGAQPGRGLIPNGGIFSASRPKPLGGLSSPDEEQTRAGGGHCGDRPQDRDNLLHNGGEAGGIRRNALGTARRRTRETVRSQTQTAGAATGLQARTYRRKTCRVTT